MEQNTKRRILIKNFLRLACALIDVIITMVPVQLFMLGVIGDRVVRTEFLFRLLFAVYGVLMVEYNNGATIGKHIGRLRVVDKSKTKPSIMYVGLRELVRAMYLIPFIGWVAALISVIMLFTTGRTLHDMAGGTDVIFRWEYEDSSNES